MQKSPSWKAIEDNLDSPNPVPWADIALAYNVKESTILQKASTIRARRAKRDQRVRDRKRRETGSTAGYDALTLNPRAVPEGSVEDIKKVAWLVIKNGRDADKMTAAKLLQSLLPKDKDAGPPPPTSEDEQIQRLALLLSSVSPEIRQKATELAATLYQPSPVVQYESKLEEKPALPDSEISPGNG